MGSSWAAGLRAWRHNIRAACCQVEKFAYNRDQELSAGPASLTELLDAGCGAVLRPIQKVRVEAL